MSATEETNVRLHASVDGFLLPDIFFFLPSAALVGPYLMSCLRVTDWGFASEGLVCAH